MKADRRHQGYDCNDCGNSRCNGDVIRLKKGVRHVPCPGSVKLGPMRVPLLHAASVHPGSLNALAVTLNRLDMRIEEIPRYPFFRFVYTRKSRR